MIPCKTEPHLHSGAARRKLENLRRLLILNEHKDQPLYTSLSANQIEVTSKQKGQEPNSHSLAQKATSLMEKQKAAAPSRKLPDKPKILDITQLASYVQQAPDKSKALQMESSLKENTSGYSNIEPVLHSMQTGKQIQVNSGSQKGRPIGRRQKEGKRIIQLEEQLNNCRKQNSKLEMEIDFLQQIEKRSVQLQRINASLQKDKQLLVERNANLEAKLQVAQRQVGQYRQQVEELYINIEIMRRNKQENGKEIGKQESRSGSYKLEQTKPYLVPQSTQAGSPRSYVGQKAVPKSILTIDKRACYI